MKQGIHLTLPNFNSVYIIINLDFRLMVGDEIGIAELDIDDFEVIESRGVFYGNETIDAFQNKLLKMIEYIKVNSIHIFEGSITAFCRGSNYKEKHEQLLNNFLNDFLFNGNGKQTVKNSNDVAKYVDDWICR
jgi:hypothetical protein